MSEKDDIGDNGQDNRVKSDEGEKKSQWAPASPYRIGQLKNKSERRGREATKGNKAQNTLAWRATAKPLPELPSRKREIQSSSRSFQDPTLPLQQPHSTSNERILDRVPSLGTGIRTYQPYGVRRTNDFYLPGVVISAYHHMTPNITAGMKESGDLLLTPRLQWILSKRRKFIVVERHVNHCITIPIYTYGKKGLAEKYSLTNEYIGVFDSAETGDHRSQSPENGYVLGVRATEFSDAQRGEFHYFDGLSYAHLTSPVCFDYASPSLHEGNIAVKDIERLLAKYYGCMPKDRVSPPKEKWLGEMEVASFEKERKV
ncbi:hypothetical protein ONS95_011902 [Cadophora gregata]|uniref:uncharacterized protein n=1 Tax=Cadophora gregata TaxID=51156 RepID=UPI0026DB664D|nr:uncharacterized protein ONS95_011902 [Cadophora gregata]KAK0117566.1 hypothetical protein ONS95_011902 [Cadophora gregata]KAK0122617.1 hypothetical protein ONS96_009657 [Cadophora gregata f. sp. sojae]